MPDCETAEGCKIPSVHPLAARALEMRDKLVRLSRLNIGAKVLDLYGATVDDLELLAIAEDELNPKEDKPDGNGHDMAAECEG